MHKDPVCGKRLNRGKAHAIVEHKGVNYSLCCPRCQAEFERAPDTFANPDWGEKVKKTTLQPYRRQTG